MKKKKKTTTAEQETTAPVEAVDEAKPDPVIVALEKKVLDAFLIFDNEGNKSVDLREIPTVLRSLGCCPTEAEVAKIVAELQNATGYVQFDDFLPIMMDILQQNKYKASNEDRLMKAFQLLDTENKSFLTQEQLQKILTEEGEPFTSEEMEEVLSVAVNTEDNNVSYKSYIPHLLYVTEKTD